MCHRILGARFIRLMMLAGLFAAACASNWVTVSPLATSRAQGPSIPVTSSPVLTSPSPAASPLNPLLPSPTPPLSSVKPAPPPIYGYQVVHTFPHDPTAFTEGLVFDGGFLYESTGLEGQSTLRKTQLETGEVLQRHDLSPDVFGEGITIFGDRIIQLTWKTRLGYVYEKRTFRLLGEFTYPTEGWGITQDGKQLIMSDGTATLYFLNPDTFERTRQVEVHSDDGPVTQLNELEYVQGEIYANVWQTDRIARIAPDTGQVLGWIDLSGLLSAEDRRTPVDVLNGIAYDAEHDRLFVTGKLWPKLFEIKLVAPK
jgi:glutamine cyclotransferase